MNAKRMASVGGKIKANHPPPTPIDHQFSSYIKNGFMNTKEERKRGWLDHRKTMMHAHAQPTENVVDTGAVVVSDGWFKIDVKKIQVGI